MVNTSLVRTSQGRKTRHWMLTCMDEWRVSGTIIIEKYSLQLVGIRCLAPNTDPTENDFHGLSSYQRLEYALNASIYEKRPIRMPFTLIESYKLPKPRTLVVKSLPSCRFLQSVYFGSSLQPRNEYMTAQGWHDQNWDPLMVVPLGGI